MPARLIGAAVASSERHRRLTPASATLTGLSTLAIVGGTILLAFSTTAPALASDTAQRGVGESSLERVEALQLPTL